MASSTLTPKQKSPPSDKGVRRSQSLNRKSDSPKGKNRDLIYDLWGSYEVAPGVRCSMLCKDGKLIDKPADEPNIETIWSGFMRGLRVNPHANCLGWREGATYKWWSYQDVADRVYKLASALSHSNLVRQQCVGIYAASKPNWVVTAMALTSRSLVIVPLYDTLGAESCNYIINQVEMTMLFVDTPIAARRIISHAKATPSLRTVVIFSEPDDELVHLAEQQNIKLVKLDDFVADGQKHFSHSSSTIDPPKPDDTYVIMYTSGTTGDPKGVIHSNRSATSNMIGIDHFFKNGLPENLCFSKDDVTLLYLPLAHAYGLTVVNWFMYKGASIGFFGGNILKLTEDADVLKPTFFPLVPRLMNRIHSKIIAELSKNAFKSKLFWYAYKRKREALLKGVITRDSIWDKLVFSKIQNLLGGRFWLGSVGSAPVSHEVLEFWRVVFGALILEGYGQTECAACATIAMGPVGGNVGHPIQCNYVKLADVPECGYFVGEGRGEICIKGNNVMVGYYKQPDKTAEAIDADGWLHTGDIGEFQPDGSVKIVDRKKNIFKLAQGEYIAPEKIENVYQLCPEVLQVFVDGSTLESFTVAVVVPESSMAEDYATKHGLDPKTLCSNAEYRRYILDSLTHIGKENKLNSLEQVKTIHLTADMFTIENGLLTPTMKNKRPQLRKYFKNEIDALYKAGPMVGGDSPQKK